MVVNILLIKLYIQAEREMFSQGVEIRRYLCDVIEDNIIGADSIKSYGKVQHYTHKFIDMVYNWPTVYRCNSRWLLQGLSILADTTGLAVTFGAAMFGISNKFRDRQPALVASAITLANRLSSVSSNICRDTGNLVIQTRWTVVRILLA